MFNNHLESEISVLVSSCDSYHFLWNDFFMLYKKYMPTNNWKIFMNTKKSPSIEGLNIYSGFVNGNESFSTRLIKTLNHIQSNYILFFLDDFFLCDYVDKKYLNAAFKDIKNNKSIGVIYLHDEIEEKYVCDRYYDYYFAVKCKDAPYKCSTQVAIWRKKYLLKLLRYGESPWHFEFIGTYRSHHYKELCLYRRDAFKSKLNYPRGGVYNRGAIRPDIRTYFKNDNLSILKSLPIYNAKKDTVNYKNTFYDKIINKLKLYPILSVYLKHIKFHNNEFSNAMKFKGKFYRGRLF